MIRTVLAGVALAGSLHAAEEPPREWVDATGHRVVRLSDPTCTARRTSTPSKWRKATVAVRRSRAPSAAAGRRRPGLRTRQTSVLELYAASDEAVFRFSETGRNS